MKAQWQAEKEAIEPIRDAQGASSSRLRREAERAERDGDLAARRRDAATARSPSSSS